MMGLAALLAYISQWEKVNQAYTVSLSLPCLKLPNTLQMKKKKKEINALKLAEKLTSPNPYT